jgi:predicted ribosomally synthesized peptide with SipW-like signal peptide
MKKLLILTMSIVLALGMIGSAFAYFSDTETSTGNSFTAGTLNLDVTIFGDGPAGKVDVHENADGTNDYVVFSDLAPGDSGSIVWNITNTGSLDGWINVTQGLSNDNDGIDTEPELLEEPGANGALTDGELDEYMHLTSSMTIDGADVGFLPQPWHGWWHDIAVYGPSLDNLPIVLPAGKTLVLTYAFSIDTTVTNIIQGDTFTANFNISLTQNHP